MKYNHLELLPEQAFQPRGKHGMTLEGGGGGPSSSTTYTSNLSKVLEPAALDLIAAGQKEYFNIAPDGTIAGLKGYTPYSTNARDYVAQFSPQQQAVFREAAGMQRPGQFQDATQLVGMAGMGGLESAQQAYGYGNAGFQSGMMGQQLGLQAAQRAAERAQQAERAGYGYGSMGAGYGAQAAALANQAQMYGGMGAGYGNRAANIGEMALAAQDYGRDVGEEARQFARQAAMTGQGYAAQATNPYAVQAYMSPYQQAVTDTQIQAAQRQADIARTQRGAQASRAGAFGGARQAIENAEANRALQSQLQAIQAQGAQSAYDRAIQSLQYGTGQNIAGLQAAQAGLGTALQGGQLGLSGIGQAIAGQQAGISGAGMGLQGLGQAGQLYGIGIQGAQAGLSGVDRALAAGQLDLSGADRGLAGTAQGMQGAQVGLQGVSGAQAGYGLVNQAGTGMANIATAQQASDLARMDFQQQLGAQQQAREQQIINQAIQNYATAQEYPFEQLSRYSGLIRGYYTPSQTTTNYQAGAPMGQQILGYGLGALGAAKALG